MFVCICRYICTFVCPQEAECAFVIILMAVYWCTEVLPLAVTALLPTILFPLFGIMQSKDVSELSKLYVCRICSAMMHFGSHTSSSVRPCCSRCACSTWRTQTCCLWGGWWLQSPWSTGIYTSASPWGCCSLSVCARHCEWLCSTPPQHIVCLACHLLRPTFT